MVHLFIDDIIMKDDQTLMKKFVMMVEAYPELYDNSVNGYRTRQAELSWEAIAERVRSELTEECSVDELRTKWKGIRSSFNRYRNKVIGQTASSCKKYYLYDYLRFLDQHTRPKSVGGTSETSGKLFDDRCNFEDDDNETSNEYNPLEWAEVDIKPDINQIQNKHKIDIVELTGSRSNVKESIDFESTKKQPNEDRNTDDDNEDMQFFRSIIPDIKNFTAKEKRKLKMQILQLIDDVENERKRYKPNT